jgi:hypothetical protein
VDAVLHRLDKRLSERAASDPIQLDIQQTVPQVRARINRAASSVREHCGFLKGPVHAVVVVVFVGSDLKFLCYLRSLLLNHSKSVEGARTPRRVALLPDPLDGGIGQSTAPFAIRVA